LPSTDGIVLLGDMNSRIGIETPIIKYSDVPLDIVRTSSDLCVNDLGSRFIKLCSSQGLVPLNGLRRLRDTDLNDECFTDAFTYYDTKKGVVASVIDYVCVNSVLFPVVQYLKLEDRKGRSDHFPLTCRLGLLHGDSASISSEQYINVPIGRKWSVKGKAFDRADLGDKIDKSLDLKEVLSKLEMLLDCDWSDLSHEVELHTYMDHLFDKFMESVRTCMVGASCGATVSRKKQVEVKGSLRARRKGNRMHKQVWYDNECKAAAKAMHLSTKCTDQVTKKRVCNEYRALCRRKREAWLAERLHEVDRVLNVDK